MPLLPSSPRLRRRLLMLALAVVVAAVAVAVALVFQQDHRIREGTSTFAVTAAPQEKPVKLSARDRRAIDNVLSVFVRTAVARKNVAASYDLVTPSLRSGISRKAWASGNIPVFEFPNDMRRVEVFHYDVTLRNDVLGEVIVLPKHGSKDQGPIGFTAELLATGNGASRKWRVDSFAPAHVYAPLTSATEAKAKAKESAKAKRRHAAPRPVRPPDVTPPEGAGRLSKAWLLVPLGLFSLIILIPVGIGLREWLLTLWVDRQSRDRRRLPDLPPRKP